MPVLRNLNLLVTDAMLLTMGLKVQKHPKAPTILAELVHVEDVLALMFSEKMGERRGWVSVARQGEGILIFLSENKNALLAENSGEVKRYVLKSPALRHVVPIDHYREASDYILEYVLNGNLPVFE